MKKNRGMSLTHWFEEEMSVMMNRISGFVPIFAYGGDGADSMAGGNDTYILDNPSTDSGQTQDRLSLATPSRKA